MKPIFMQEPKRLAFYYLLSRKTRAPGVASYLSAPVMVEAFARVPVGSTTKAKVGTTGKLARGWINAKIHLPDRLQRLQFLKALEAACDAAAKLPR